MLRFSFHYTSDSAATAPAALSASVGVWQFVAMMMIGGYNSGGHAPG